jgi:hypothetical protein
LLVVLVQVGHMAEAVEQAVFCTLLLQNYPLVQLIQLQLEQVELLVMVNAVAMVEILFYLVLR